MLRPDDLPVAVVADQFEILIFIQGPDRRSPLEICAYQGLIAVIGDDASIGILQLRKSLKTAVLAGDVATYGGEIDVARGGDQSISFAVVVGLHAVVKGPNCTLGRSGPFFLSGGCYPGGDQHASDDGHEDGKKSTHDWASRRTTGSSVAEAGKSMVSALRRRSGNRIRSARANNTVPMGSVPQSRLSNRVGTAPGGGVILCAGGTSSL